MGTAGAEKTAFVNKWTKNNYGDTYKPTITSDYGLKLFKENGSFYRIQLWDLAAYDSRFATLKIFAKDADGAIIMFDAINPKTREE